MMNSTELIIGHFEGSLTPAEASQLDELMRTSPEVRAAFEQQRAIEEGMLEDSEALVAPIGLREATLAAALGGALTTTVGGGIAAWLSTKAAVVLSTLALGGVIVGGIVFSDDDAGEEIETVVAPGQMERVESVDPVGGEPVTDDDRASNTVGNAEVTTSTAASTQARVREIQSRNSGSSTNGDETNVSDSPTSSPSGTNTSDELDLNGQGNPVQMPQDPAKVTPSTP